MSRKQELEPLIFIVRQLSNRSFAFQGKPFGEEAPVPNSKYDPFSITLGIRQNPIFRKRFACERPHLIIAKPSQ
jgi:hypothetical protein